MSMFSSEKVNRTRFDAPNDRRLVVDLEIGNKFFVAVFPRESNKEEIYMDLHGGVYIVTMVIRPGVPIK